jgi:hypothetical protein
LQINPPFFRKYISLIIILLALNSTCFSQENVSLLANEQLKYRIHLGFIDAAEATIHTNGQTQQINNRQTRKIDIIGKTVGILDIISPVVDYWSAYLDTETHLPLKTESRKKEGRYRKEETVIFDHANQVAKITSPQNTPTIKNFPIESTTLDLIGGYFFLRDKPLGEMKIGQKQKAKILVDGSIYEIWFIVKGFEKIESHWGNKNCIRTTLVLPKNKLFKEEDAIQLWITNDKYQVPFKMEVNLKIGFLTIDLTQYTIAGKSIY